MRRGFKGSTFLKMRPVQDISKLFVSFDALFILSRGFVMSVYLKLSDLSSKIN